MLERPLDVGAGLLIWIAQDEVLGKQVALHFLPSAISRDAAAIEELRHEVKRNRPLIHPGVLRVYDLVEADDLTAVATETFEARCLAAILEGKGHFEVEDLESWLDAVCVTLEEAHRIKLTHRDLAPQNVFVTATGGLLLANFGISRVVQDALHRANGESSARIHTLSPQLIEGAAPSVTDDVYGVGALFYELLSGQPIFSGSDVAEKIRRSVPPRISESRRVNDKGTEIPPGWDNVIAACLNKRSDERPQRPSEIVSSIEAYLPLAESSPVAQVEVHHMLSEYSEEAPTEVESILPKFVQEGQSTPPTPEPAASPDPEIEAEAFAKVVAVPNNSIGSEPVLASPVESDSIDSTPVVTEPVKAAAKRSALRPLEYDGTEEDAFSAILPRRFRFPAAVAAAVALFLLLINGFFKPARDETPTPSLATSDLRERSELTSVKNSLPETAALAKRPPDTEPPVPVAMKKSPPIPEMVVVAGPTPSAPPKVSASATVSSASLSDKQISDKAATLERLKQDLEATEKIHQTRLKDQQTAAVALAEARKAIDEKTKAVGTAKKIADDLLAARKKREDEQKVAETAARAAEQLAAEKLRAAEDARKALADFEAQNREKLTAQEKMEAEIQGLQRTLSDRQKNADESAKAVAGAETARQHQLALIEQTEKELAESKAHIAKASAEGERQRQAMDAERRKLDDEIAAMKALFEQKMKDIEDRRRQIETAPAAGAPSAQSAPPASAELKPLQTATPAPTLPLMALKTDPGKVPPPATPAPAGMPVEPVATSASINSLGMRFVPVGDVLFCVWQTRVRDFETFAKAVNLKSTAWRGPGFRQGPDHPVVNVTWTEALAFCKWLSDKEHKEGSLPANQFYRLPYDLEWSKTVALPDETGKTPEARDMGVPDVYPWGTEWPPTKGAGNYTGEETGSDVAIKGYDDGFAWTSPVGSFPPNKLGLYDSGGNVWQWCMDSWNNESKTKVLRGASWYNGALKLSLLSSCRIHAAPDSSTDNYGFRIVRATDTVAGRSAKK